LQLAAGFRYECLIAITTIMRTIVLLTLSLFLSPTLWSQSTSIRGTLVDSSDKKNLQNSVISLLYMKDTTLTGFTRADANGHFELAAPDSSGQYLLLVTHPYFADYLDSVKIVSGQQVNLGIIHLFSKIKMLEEVIVRGNRAIILRGDTTVFTADSFKVAEGANVEELLRKLPGITVDRTGKITAMGENVKKVLVDGEEFFGTDPGIATKNLRADVVQEVQVFDKKSDQAAFTGIDDGVRDKTINLKLKDDKKKGYFGKIDVGAGIKDGKQPYDNSGTGRYYGAAMINAFQGKRKLAGYGISSNTGFMNLSWDDADKYGASSNVQVTAEGGIMITSGGDDWNSSNGIPINYNAGIHYSNKFNEDKNSVNLGYRYVDINSPGNTRVFSKNFVKDSSWSMNSQTDFRNINQKHAANLILESKLDSMNTLKLTMTGNLNYTNNRSTYYAENINDKNGQFINTNNRKSTGNSDQSAYNANLLWMHKFKKAFRTVSINGSFNNNMSNSDGFLYSKIDFYRDNVVDSTSIIDQRNLVDNKSNTFNTRAAYTEPLAKDFYMETSYAFNYNKRNNIRNILAKGNNGEYDRKIDSLSNEFEYNDMSNAPGLSFRYSNTKVNLNFGSSVAFTKYEQINKTENTSTDFSFANHYPRASFYYKLKPQEGFRFNYNGNTSAPNLNQLQPIRVNTDPLNIFIGNPDLRPSFSHRFSLNYNSWKMLSQRSIFVAFDYGFTQNAFASLNYIKDAVRTTQTVNTNGMYNYNAFMWFDRKIQKINLSVGFNPSYNFSQRVDFIAGANGQSLKNLTVNETYNMRLSIGKDEDKKYRVYLRPYVGYNVARATVNTMANAKYWTSGGGLWSTFYLPKEFEINNNIDAQFRQKDPRFPTNNNFVFWDADIAKWFHKRQFQVKLAVRDALNQRNGYNRNFGSSSFTETYNTVLRRHFLLGFVWNFSKMNAGNNSNQKDAPSGNKVIITK